MANVQIDPTKSALQNLLALIDSQNPSGPTAASQITTSNLTAVTVGSVSNDTTANTSVQVNSASGSNYTGSVTVYYAREALADQISAVGGSVAIPIGSSDAATMLSLVETHYGFIPGEISWVSTPTYPAGGGAGTGSIQASGSVVYVDGSATVNLNWAAHNTSLLMHFDGVNGSTVMTDSTDEHTATSTGIGLSTTQSKFGGSSLYVGGTSGSNITVSDSPDIRLGANGDCTLEGWFYMTGGGVQALFCKAPNGSPPYNHFATDGASWYVYLGGSSTAFTAPIQTPVLNAWHHLALVFHSGVWTLYDNGVATGSASGGTFGNNTAPLYLGNWPSNAPFSGYIDEFRISNFARYTANFTPPTAAFTLD